MKNMSKRKGLIKMFEDKQIFRFVCALLAFACIIIPGPIIPIISLIISIGMLIHRIKLVKEGSVGFEVLFIDIVLIITVLVISIGFSVSRIAIENEYNKYIYSSNSSDEMDIDDFAQTAIYIYQLGNISQFSDNENHQTAIKNGFYTYLTNDLGFTDVSIKGNKITCNIGTDTIIFTITKNDIKYTIK